jgi:hypothetical protein
MIIFVMLFTLLIVALGVCIFMAMIDPSLFESARHSSVKKEYQKPVICRLKSYSEMTSELSYGKEARRKDWPEASHVYVDSWGNLKFYNYYRGITPWRPNDEELNATDWEVI